MPENYEVKAEKIKEQGNQRQKSETEKQCQQNITPPPQKAGPNKRVAFDFRMDVFVSVNTICRTFRKHFYTIHRESDRCLT
jgi:hypothetical protein